jgi:organic radical activating enzyme
MDNNKLDVCEIYRTIKSSGVDSGKPVLCIRLFGTNFEDKNDRRGYAWSKNEKSLKKNREVMLVSDAINEIDNIKGDKMQWLITGGEALLQQESILTLYKEFQKTRNGDIPYIEIETNGLVQPLKPLDKIVDKYTVNIKLGNSLNGDSRSTFGRRIKESVIQFYLDSDKAYFVFEVDSESDIKEVDELVRLFKIPADRIWLKPLSIDSRGVIRNISILWNACLHKGYNLSNRFYMFIHGNDIKRGI